MTVLIKKKQQADTDDVNSNGTTLKAAQAYQVVSPGLSGSIIFSQERERETDDVSMVKESQSCHPNSKLSPIKQ